MKKFFKFYGWMALFIIYNFVVGAFCCVQFFPNSLEENMLLLTASLIYVLVIGLAIYAIMIYCFIHIAKNKNIKKPFLWCGAIYFLNVFVIPYYHLKHICKDDRAKIKTIIYLILMAVSFALGIFVIVPKEDAKTSSINFNDKNNKIVVKATENYTKKDVGQYDLYLKDQKQKLNCGFFIYSNEEFKNSNTILSTRYLWLQETRKPIVSLEEKFTEEVDRKITTKMYSGYYDNSKNVYFISTVDFLEYDVVVNTICTQEYDKNYLKSYYELNKLLSNMEYIGTN